jgi:hypothetical protein
MLLAVGSISYLGAFTGEYRNRIIRGILYIYLYIVFYIIGIYLLIFFQKTIGSLKSTMKMSFVHKIFH